MKSLGQRVIKVTLLFTTSACSFVASALVTASSPVSPGVNTVVGFGLVGGFGMVWWAGMCGLVLWCWLCCSLGRSWVVLRAARGGGGVWGDNNKIHPVLTDEHVNQVGHLEPRRLAQLLHATNHVACEPRVHHPALVVLVAVDGHHDRTIVTLHVRVPVGVEAGEGHVEDGESGGGGMWGGKWSAVVSCSGGDLCGSEWITYCSVLPAKLRFTTRSSPVSSKSPSKVRL